MDTKLGIEPTCKLWSAFNGSKWHCGNGSMVRVFLRTWQHRSSTDRSTVKDGGVRILWDNGNYLRCLRVFFIFLGGMAVVFPTPDCSSGKKRQVLTVTLDTTWVNLRENERFSKFWLTDLPIWNIPLNQGSSCITVMIVREIEYTRPGKHTKSYGKSPSLMGKWTISMCHVQ